MTDPVISELNVSSIQHRREYLTKLRAEADRRRTAGVSGIAVCDWYSDQLDELLRQMLKLHLVASRLPSESGFCLIAVGGNARRRPAPYSDLDLLMVCGARSVRVLQPVLTGFVRDCWDTGFQLGHSIRTPDDVAGFACEDVQFATSLVQMRMLLGDTGLFGQLSELVQRKVFANPVDRFISLCVASRRTEWMARGDSVNQLEPDVKRSPGGLRDLHLLAWVAFAQFGKADLHVLLENNAISRDELNLLQSADEFLTSLRLDLHCRAKLKQDVLTRELQLQIAASRGETRRDHRRTVETFMQEYFLHTSRVAEIARRVTESEQKPTLLSRLKSVILSPRDLDGFTLIDGVLSATDDYTVTLKKQPEDVMRAFVIAARHGVMLSGELRKIIGDAAMRLPSEPGYQSCSRFRAVLRSGTGLPQTLRAMFETKVLDWLVPAMSEIRCLMQFNQYHSYTVDEHTLKTIDEVVTFEDDQTPLGTA